MFLLFCLQMTSITLLLMVWYGIGDFGSDLNVFWVACFQVIMHYFSMGFHCSLCFFGLAFAYPHYSSHFFPRRQTLTQQLCALLIKENLLIPLNCSHSQISLSLCSWQFQIPLHHCVTHLNKLYTWLVRTSHSH